MKREMDFCIRNNMLTQIWTPLPSGDPIYRVLLPKALQTPYIASVHRSETSCHLGVDKMIAALRQRVIFAGMYEAVKTYVGSCDICLSVKHSRQQVHSPPSLYDQCSQPFERVHVDFAGPLNMTRSGNRYIAIASDACSGYIIAWPCRTLSAESFARDFMRRITYIFGSPQRLVSDNGSTFRARLWSQVAKAMGTKLTFSAPYCPRTNGTAEQGVAKVKVALSCLAWEKEGHWDENLPAVVYGLNACRHSSHDLTPHEIIFGRTAKLPIDVPLMEQETEPLFRIVQSTINHQDVARRIAHDFKAKQDESRLKYRPKEHRYNDLVPGDICYWRKPQIKKGQGIKVKKNFGPYLVIGRNGSKASLRDLTTGQTHPLKVHVEQLHKARRFIRHEDPQLQRHEPIYRPHVSNNCTAPTREE